MLRSTNGMRCQMSALFDRNSSEYISTVTQLSEIAQRYDGVHSYVCTALCVFGLCANVINVSVLTRPWMRTSANTILAAIACCDTGCMASYLVYQLHFGLPHAVGTCHEDVYTLPWLYFVLFHQLCSIVLHTTSLWLAVVLAFIRLAVIWRSRLAPMITSTRNLCWTIALTGAITFMWSVPLSLTTAVVPFYGGEMRDCRKGMQPDGHNVTRYTVDLSSLAVSQDCLLLRASLWISGFLFKLLPCLLLSVLIILLLKTYTAARERNTRIRALSMLPMANNMQLQQQQAQTTADNGHPPVGADIASTSFGAANQPRLPSARKLSTILMSSSYPRRGRPSTLPSRRARQPADPSSPGRSDLLLPSHNAAQSAGLFASVLTLLGVGRRRPRRRMQEDEDNNVCEGGGIQLAPTTSSSTRQRSTVLMAAMTAPVTAFTHRTTVMLTAILIIFLATEVPQVVISVLGGLYPTDIYADLYPIVANALDLLSLLNSSVNFLLYCAMSSQFRETFSLLYATRLASLWRALRTVTRLCGDKRSTTLGIYEGVRLNMPVTTVIAVPKYKWYVLRRHTAVVLGSRPSLSGPSGARSRTTSVSAMKRKLPNGIL